MNYATLDNRHYCEVSFADLAVIRKFICFIMDSDYETTYNEWKSIKRMLIELDESANQFREKTRKSE